MINDGVDSSKNVSIGLKFKYYLFIQAKCNFFRFCIPPDFNNLYSKISVMSFLRVSI